jgi:hypothetical protein
VGKNEVVSTFPHPGINFRGSFDRFYRKTVAQSLVDLNCQYLWQTISTMMSHGRLEWSCFVDPKIIIFLTTIGWFVVILGLEFIIDEQLTWSIIKLEDDFKSR